LLCRAGQGCAAGSGITQNINMTPDRMAVLMLVDARHGLSDLQALAQVLGPLASQSAGALTWHWIDGGASPQVRAWLQAPPGAAGERPALLDPQHSLAAAASALDADWLVCVDPADPRAAARLAQWRPDRAARPADAMQPVATAGSARPVGARGLDAETGTEIGAEVGTWRDWAIGRAAWAAVAADAASAGAAGATPALAALPLDWVADGLLWHVLQVAPAGTACRLPAASAWLVPEPAHGHWLREAVYQDGLDLGLVRPLEAGGPARPAPRWLQRAALAHLKWFFEVDRRERAPTVFLSVEAAPAFHALMARALARIDRAVLDEAAAQFSSAEVFHALRSYQGGAECTPATLDAYDHHAGLARLRYDVHGEPPAERWLVDGAEQAPAHAKYRACVFFHRRLFRQRIAWVPAPNGAAAALQLAGRPVPVYLGPAGLVAPAAPPPAPAALCAQAARTLDDRKGGQQPLPPGRAGWRVRLLAALAAMPWARRRYRDAWVFVDRDDGADDSAEHLYRWVREHHPQINAWYLLRPDTPDWPRLEQEGFRLLAPGLQRKLLALNCRHVISSHTEHEFGMDRALYGDRMRFRYSFLQHGIIKDDISHWLNPCRFDRFITSSPGEYASIVGDDTTYVYTSREVCRTGLPRHDRLLRFAAEAEARAIEPWVLVMPTWRAGLVDQRTPEAERLAAFRRSDYATAWRDLLNDQDLAASLARAGLRLAFMPHANAAPFVEAFDVPAHVTLVHMVGDQVQRSFARARLFITDYTSAAFEMALLRRPVLYYQFDRDSFYRGGHNWRPGYFDYERDGFGPVVFDAAAAKRQLLDLVADGCRPPESYLRRMAAAMPERDGLACQRTFDSIQTLG